MRAMPRRPSKPMTVVAVNLRRLRAASGLSQEALAMRSGVGRTTIAFIESGDSESPQRQTLEALAQALGVRVSDLIEDPSVQHIPTERLISDFLASDWGRVTQPTPDELQWLRSLPGIFWVNVEPSMESLHLLVLAYRKRKVS